MTQKLSDANEIKRAADWLEKYWKKSPHPEYYDARSVNEAVGLLNEYGEAAKIVGGGTDLLSLMKNKVILPKVLVNIKNIPGLRYIHESESGLSIGPMTLINDIQSSPIIKKKYPLLYDTARSMASPQIRNMATIGGSLLQEVRCWYFRRSPDTGTVYNCLRKALNAPCFAAGGENQYHAIIGAHQCVAVCPSDMATTLLALGAHVYIVSANGSRVLKSMNFALLSAVTLA
jgi:xanthine dehydrogenase YagS FAD-binding subunit